MLLSNRCHLSKTKDSCGHTENSGQTEHAPSTRAPPLKGGACHHCGVPQGGQLWSAAYAACSSLSSFGCRPISSRAHSAAVMPLQSAKLSTPFRVRERGPAATLAAVVVLPCLRSSASGAMQK